MSGVMALSTTSRTSLTAVLLGLTLVFAGCWEDESPEPASVETETETEIDDEDEIEDEHVSTGISCDAITTGEGTVDAPYAISDLAALQAMNEDLQAHYVVCADIDASATKDWTDEVGTGAGFVPIGTPNAAFTGTFDGRGFTVASLHINRPAEDHVGLFGRLGNGAEISNVGLTKVDVVGGVRVGGLVGSASGTSEAQIEITNADTTGRVHGGHSVGGLVGSSQARVNVRGSHSEAKVSGGSAIAGLVGTMYSVSSIENSFSTGDVEATDGPDAGGLAAYVSGFSSVKTSYSTGNVSAVDVRVGGLVGYLDTSASVENSYSRGNVSGESSVGGLVGAYGEGYLVENSYSTGKVTGTSNVGGLIGWRKSSGYVVKNSYWDEDTSELDSSNGGSGRTTVAMKSKATFVGWKFDAVWTIDEGNDYPDLIDNPRR